MKQVVSISAFLLGFLLVLGVGMSYANTFQAQYDDFVDAGWDCDGIATGCSSNGSVHAHCYKSSFGHEFIYANSLTSTVYFMNPDIVTVDYWYSSCLPLTSDNGVQDEDEEGIDCGGSTGIECVHRCPDGYTLESGWCRSNEPVGEYPASSAPDFWNAEEWGEWPSEPTPLWDNFPAIPSSPDADLGDYSSSESSLEPEPVTSFTSTTNTTNDFSTTTNSDGSTVDVLSESSITSNSDGTGVKTDTTTTTTTSADGSSTVDVEVTTITYDTVNSTFGASTSSTTSSYDSDGNLISSDQTDVDINDDADFSDVEEGAGFGLDTDGDGKGDGVERLTVSDVDFGPLRLSANNLMSRFPFSLITRADILLDTWIVTPQSPEINFSLPIISSDPFVMDLSLLDPLAAFLRACLAFTAVVSGMYMIIKTWV